MFKRKQIFISSLLSVLLILGGCTTMAEEPPKEPPTVEETAIKEFKELMQVPDNGEEIEAFIQLQTDILNKAYIQAMVKAYEAYLDAELTPPENKLHMNLISYDKLLQFKDFLSPEYLSYLTLFKNEETNGSLNTQPVLNHIDQLLDSAAMAEEFLLAYPDSDYESAVYELYVRYLYASMMNNGNPLSLSSHPESLQMLSDFTAARPDTHTASFTAYYLQILDDSGYETESQALQDFYFNFYSLLRSYLWNDPVPQD